MNWLVRGACGYYALSAVTLPFANKVWFGELPVFGLFQIPKSFVKSVIHDALLHVVQRLGWSAGSASPDYGMTHLWAMVSMTTIPAIVLIAIIACLSRGRSRVSLVIAVVSCAAIDAIVTLSFDASSSLSLYNAFYFR